MNKRIEMKRLIRLSAPVALSQLALVGMGVTDVLVAGRAGTDQLAGMMLGNSVWNLVAFFFFGIGLAAQPLVGHAFGADDLPRVRRVFQNALYAAIATGLVCMLAIWIAAQVIPRLGYDLVLAQVGQRYLSIMALGGLAICVLPVLRSTLEAMNQTAPVTRVMVLGFLVNIPLDVILVFGWGPLPAMGAAGCAVASVAILWLNLSMLFLLARGKHNRHIGLLPFSARPEPRLQWDYFKLGLPIGATITAELSFFVVAAMLIAYFGPAAASAHSVAISTASIAFMFYMGLGQGIAIRASQLVGAGKMREAAFTIRCGVELTLAVAISASVLLLTLRHQIPGIYTPDTAVTSLAAILLAWAALFQLVDAMQCVGMHGLRAYRDTVTPIFFQTISFWLMAFPVGYWLATSERSLISGPQGYWAGMTLGLTIAAALIGLQLRRKMRKSQLLAGV